MYEEYAGSKRRQSTRNEERTRNMEIMGIVKHIRPYEKKDFRMGIGFTEISQEDKFFLDSFTKNTDQ